MSELVREREGERREGGREGGKGEMKEGLTLQAIYCTKSHVHIPCEVQHYTVICNCATRFIIIMALYSNRELYSVHTYHLYS